MFFFFQISSGSYTYSKLKCGTETNKEKEAVLYIPDPAGGGEVLAAANQKETSWLEQKVINLEPTFVAEIY